MTTTIKLTPKRRATLKRITLRCGNHTSPEEGLCVMEAAAFIAGERHSDHPQCACAVITEFMMKWNDALPSDEDRDRLLKPLIPVIIGTRAGKAVEKARREKIERWFYTVQVPAWLDAASLAADESAALRAASADLPLRDFKPLLVTAAEAAKKAADAAWAAARAAARAAAWDAARAAAWDAAWAAARAAAWDAARAAAWDAAWAAARAAAWAAAWAAARAAAWDAARDAASAAAWAAARAAARAAAWAAAWDAARAAAWDAVKTKFAPTVSALQTSAVKLVRELTAMKEAA